jgi:hypothetical protein
MRSVQPLSECFASVFIVCPISVVFSTGNCELSVCGEGSVAVDSVEVSMHSRHCGGGVLNRLCAKPAVCTAGIVCLHSQPPDASVVHVAAMAWPSGLP